MTSPGTPAARGRGSHLVLVGMMGSGKSTVGRRCAEALGRPFVDTDDLIEASTRLTVGEVFATYGEEHFRELESQALLDACSAPVPQVVACGGGVVVQARNRRALRDCGLVVWLRAPVEVLAARVREGAGRPLLAGGDPEAALRRLGRVRGAAYEQVADVVVDAGGTVDDVVEEVLSAVTEAAR